MTVEAFILVRSNPGSTKPVVMQISQETKPGSGKYMMKGVKQVYRATGEYDVIVYASAGTTEEIFKLADDIGAIKSSTQPATQNVQVIILGPKKMGDP
jgi:hypothetical protein